MSEGQKPEIKQLLHYLGIANFKLLNKA